MKPTGTPKTRYTVTIVECNGPTNETSFNWYTSGGEAIAAIEAYLEGHGRPWRNAMMMQEAEAAQWQLGRWRGESIKLLGYLNAIYLLPQAVYPSSQATALGRHTFGEATWQEYEDAASERRRQTERAETLRAMVETLGRANRDGVTAVDDVVGYCRDAMDQGLSLTSLHCAIRGLDTEARR